jgi:catechol 2,3-dioxygenase-like lactoylglutathione lyase family enzyme
MNPKIDTITLGVSGVEHASDFYERAFGGVVRGDRKAPVVSFGDAASPLALRPWEALAHEAGLEADSRGFRGFTLSYIVDTADAVDQLLDRAERSGGEVSKPPKNAPWGYSAYVTDPGGHLWKIASSKRRPLFGGKKPASPNGVITPKELPITIGVADMKASKEFYKGGLNLPVKKAFGNKFVMFSGEGGRSDLGMYKREALAQDAAVSAEGSGFRGFSITHLVDTADRVDDVLARADRAGATIVKPPVGGDNGDYSGYFADLDGNLWQVASHN